jgi:hypothetical protein
MPKPDGTAKAGLDASAKTKRTYGATTAVARFLLATGSVI